MSARAGCRDEVDEFLHTTEQTWLEILVRVDALKNASPTEADIFRCFVMPSEAFERSNLDIFAPRNVRPGRDPDYLRFNCLPHINVRVSEYEHTGHVTDPLGDSRFFRARNEMIDEDTGAAGIRGVEDVQYLFEIVDSLEFFNHYAFEGKILAPDFRDQFGVVLSLHPDAGGFSDAGAPALNVERTRGGALAALSGRCRRWRNKVNGPSIDPISAPHRERTAQSASPFELDLPLAGDATDAHDLTDESGLDVFEEHTARRFDFPGLGIVRVGTVAVWIVTQNVAAVAVEGWCRCHLHRLSV